MNFRNFNGLRIFDSITRNRSLTAAAEELSLTKSAVSYQLNQLEYQLGFKVFERSRRGMNLTHKGEVLWHTAQSNLTSIENCVNELRDTQEAHLHVRLSTYFASRWLSPRLMNFIQQHPEIRISIEPAIDPGEFEAIHESVSIRWGKGTWPGTHNEELFASFSRPIASPALATLAQQLGLENFFQEATLLQDADESHAWSDWFAESNLKYSRAFDRLSIKDPNVRVQAVIDGQGIALYDQLIEPELENGTLIALTSTALSGYGYYLCYPLDAIHKAEVRAFRDWMIESINK